MSNTKEQYKQELVVSNSNEDIVTISTKDDFLWLTVRYKVMGGCYYSNQVSSPLTLAEATTLISYLTEANSKIGGSK